MLVTQLAFRMQEGSVLCKVFTVHDEMLPVHVDQEARGIDSQAAHAVDSVEGGGYIAHENVHSRFTVFVFHENRHAFGGGMRHNFAYSGNELIPRVGIVALEVVVVALGTRPDNEVCPECGCK